MKKSDLRHIIRRIIREQKNRIPDKPFIPKPIGPISTDLPQSPLAPAGATPVDCRKLTQYAFDYGDATMTPYQFCVKCSTGSIVDDYCDCCISGCTDSEALNYNINACYDDGSCIEIITGCTDVGAYNYDPTANVSDPSLCLYDAGCYGGPGIPYWLNDPCYAWVI